MTEVYLVYGHLQYGGRLTLKAYATRGLADRYVQRATRRPWDDEMRSELASAADLLDIVAFSVEPLPVESE